MDQLSTNTEWQALSEQPVEWRKIEIAVAKGEEIICAKIWPWIQQYADLLGVDTNTVTPSNILAEKRASNMDELAIYIHRGSFWQYIKMHPSLTELGVTTQDIAYLEVALFYEKEKEQSRIGVQNFINMWLRTNGMPY